MRNFITAYEAFERDEVPAPGLASSPLKGFKGAHTI